MPFIPAQTTSSTATRDRRRFDAGSAFADVAGAAPSRNLRTGQFAAAPLIATLTRMSAVVARPAEEGDDLLVDLLELVCTMVPGAHWATLSTGSDENSMHPLVATHRRARAADELQFRLRSGPTLEAAHRRGLVVVDDLTTDGRWPVFAGQLTGPTPVRSILALPVDGIGAGSATLTLYGGIDHGFADEASAIAVTIAVTALAGLTQRRLVAALHRELLANRRIGVAVGMLMVSHRHTEDQALQTLLDAGRASDQDVADIADDIILTGSLPAENRVG